jgi:PAS domain S-box-containing protein
MDFGSADRKTLVLVFVLLIVCGLAITYLAFQTRDALKDAVRDELKSVAIAIAVQVDGDTLTGLRPGDENTTEFQAVRDTLHRVQAANTDIRYVYTMRRNGDAVEFIVDGDYGYAANAAVIGQVYPYVNNEMLKGFETASADTIFTTDQWGTVLSGYYPVRNRSGSVVGLVGVDMDRQKVLDRQNYINWGFYLLILISIFMVAVGILWAENVRSCAERQIQVSEQKFRSLAESSIAGIFLIQKGIIRYTNPAMSVILGYTGDEMVGRRFWDFLPPGWQEPVRERNIAREAGKEGPTRYEMQVLRKDGEKRWIALSVGTLKYENAPATIGTLYDITELKEKEERLQEMHTKLDLVTGITFHDITNSLTPLFGYLDLVRESISAPTEKMLLEKAEDATRAIQVQVQSARLYREIGNRAPEWIPVASSLKSAAKTLDLSQVALVTELGDLEVLADPLIERVFYNLLENTLRHGEHASTIRVSWQFQGAGIVLVYEDNGIGIPDTDKERIFQPGFGKHTGYGLSIARDVLAITGMEIHERGTFREGARFEIRVPPGKFRTGPASQAREQAGNP